MRKNLFFLLPAIILLCSGCNNPQGKLNIVLTAEIQYKDFMLDVASVPDDTVFMKCITLASNKYWQTSKDFFAVFGECISEADPSQNLQSWFPSSVNAGGTTSDEDVLNALRLEMKKSAEISKDIIVDRIHQSGIPEKHIKTKIEGNRIHFQIEGVQDPERIRALIQTRGLLEFRETFDNSELSPILFEADQVLRDYLTAAQPAKKESVTRKTEYSLLEQIELENMEQSEELNEHPLLSIFYPMVDAQTREPYKGASIGIAHSKDTAKINSYLKVCFQKGLFPASCRFLWAVSPAMYAEGNNTDQYYLYNTRTSDAPALTGDVIDQAKAKYEKRWGQYYILIQMNEEGAKEWEVLTRQNIGKAICMVVDEKVYSAPMVQSEITGGSSQISGNFTAREAEDLATILNHKALPHKLLIINENIVERE